MIQYKTLIGQPLDIDTGKKRVKIAIASFGDEDSDKDIILPGAANKSLKERGPKGSNQIWHLSDHIPSLKAAFGKFSEMGIEKDKLWGLSEYRENDTWKNAWPLYEAGDITEHSIGFSIPKNGSKTEKGIRYISEIKLYEGSSVLWGANSNTPTMMVGKSMTFEEKKDYLTREIDYILKNLHRIDEETLILFEIKLQQLQTLVADFENTIPAVPAGTLEPGKEERESNILTQIHLLTAQII